VKQNFRYLLTFAINFSIPEFLTNFIQQAGVTLLLINISNQTQFILNVKNHITVKANEVAKFREEYHLTPKDNNLRSHTMLLNGIPLKLTKKGDIPTTDPVHNNVRSPIYINPLSIAFIVYPNFDAPACARH
jgi:heparanase